jgi:hypothetical protein
VRITAKVNPKFAACPLSLQLGRFSLGGDLTIRPDGTISERRTVPNDAKPGTSTVRLATTGGQVLAETSFEILTPEALAASTQRPWERNPLWLLVAVAALLLLVTAVPAIRGERGRRQRRWVRQHVRAEPHSSPIDVTVDRDPHSAPTFAIRLQPHNDIGTQTLKEGG